MDGAWGVEGSAGSASSDELAAASSGRIDAAASRTALGNTGLFERLGEYTAARTRAGLARGTTARGSREGSTLEFGAARWSLPTLFSAVLFACR